jgi:hypothetical protein
VEGIDDLLRGGGGGEIGVVNFHVVVLSTGIIPSYL